MKRVALVSLLVAGLASSAMAGPIGDTGAFELKRVYGYYYNNGGEFTVFGYGTSLTNESYSSAPGAQTRDITGATAPSFQTFCLELTEQARTPDYFVVGSSAVKGGTSDPSHLYDPISYGTAWLYSQFATGVLSVPLVGGAGNYFAPGGPSRSTEAGLLQNALWMLEQELLTTDSRYNLSNPYYAAAVSMFGAEAAGDAPVGYLDVYVLNNFATAAQRDAFVKDGSISGVMQDFLYLRTTAVPDGGTTMMLLGGALIGLGVLRRRFSA